jgi:undecaprenyl-diphosphatase
MDPIVRFDTYLFHLINTGFVAGWLDTLMPYVTEKFNFLGAIIVASVLILVLGKRKDRWGLLLLVFVVLSSDLLSNTLKHLFMRIRPCNALEGVRLLAGCSHSYSFPSSHATNIFAAMVFLTARYRRFFPVFLTIAVTVAYSRVYVGVHYPLDVAGGAVFGSVVAIVWFEADRRFTKVIVEYYRKKRGAVEQEQ